MVVSACYTGYRLAVSIWFMPMDYEELTMPNTREKLIELLTEGHKRYLFYDQIADYLVANGVTVTDNNVGDKILCQNCTHHDTEDCPPNRVWCKHLKRRMKPEGYCSYGKPKQNKQQTITEETLNALHKLGEQAHENSRDTSL